MMRQSTPRVSRCWRRGVVDHSEWPAGLEWVTGSRAGSRQVWGRAPSAAPCEGGQVAHQSGTRLSHDRGPDRLGGGAILDRGRRCDRPELTHRQPHKDQVGLRHHLTRRARRDAPLGVLSRG